MEVALLTATTRGETTRFEVRPGQPSTLGRSSSCSIRLRDPKVSRVHCQLLLVADKLRVTDLDSSQGLMCRGLPSKEFEIEVGDGFHLGQTFVRFDALATAAEADAAAPAPVPAALPPVESAVPTARTHEVTPARTPAAEPAEPRPATLPTGTQVGKFVLEAVLGRSDRCTVYRAQQTDLQRQVALKVLDAGADERQTEAFLADVRHAATIVDPFLVPVLEIGQDGSTCFASLELVRGTSLAAQLDGGRRMPWHKLVPVLADTAAGLATLHDHGRVHGAVQGHNVFVLDTGGGKLADARGSARTRPHEPPEFSAPEQLDGRPTGPAADLYTLGCVAHLALIGESPFRGARDAVLAAQRRHAVPSLREVDAAIPAALDQLVCSLLALDPAARPGSAAAVRTQLLAVLAPATPPPEPPAAAPRIAAIVRPVARPQPEVDYPDVEPETRQRPGKRKASRGKVFAARLTGELIVFSIILVVAIAVLVVLKIKFDWDIYRLFEGVTGRK